MSTSIAEHRQGGAARPLPAASLPAQSAPAAAPSTPASTAVDRRAEPRSSSPSHALDSALQAARAQVTRAAAVMLASVDASDLAHGIATAARLESQLTALRLALTAEADRRGIAQESGATGTDAWAARLTGATPRAAALGVRLARLLDSRYGCTRDAFAAGRLNQEQACVIVYAAERLPAGTTDADRAAAEAALVAKAVTGTDAHRLRQAARRMLEAVPEDGARRADRDEADRLQTEERRAEGETWLSLGDNGDGTWSGRFTVPALHGELLRAALERLTAPRRLSRNALGDVVHDSTLTTDGPTMPWTERLGLGFCELVEHLPAGGFGRSGMGIMVHLDLAHLLDGLGSARLDTGAHLSAGEARRLACSAGLIPAVLGSASLPLDLGRETRLHTTAQARALSAVHDTCAAEGCERPFAWCDIHHRQPWALGGRTDLANAVPLCGWHHHRAHDDRFDHRTLPDGRVRFSRRR